ncbi:hypothetical protein ABW20_dc0101950 [Dactylellina cionopaga]|nr:hypothetical protein ABW20_dc0101950 [Dactylellina cionopaga]
MSHFGSRYAQSYEEYQRAEEVRRRQREMEAEHRDFLQTQEGSSTESNMRRLQEHRNRHYELLHRASLQRQVDQLHAQNHIQSSTTARPAPLNSWYTSNWPINHHSPPAMNNRSSEEQPPLPFGITAEDDPSSNSEGDYEDLIPLDPPLADDESFFSTLVDGYLSRFPNNENPQSQRRTSRLRRHFTMNSDDHSSLSGPSASSNRTSEELRERFPSSRIDRNRRFREREREADLIRSRHNEAIRDIASLVTGARDAGVMGFPHRWSRDTGSGSSGSGRPGNNNSQRTLDHPERPDNMKEEDLKIMVDCKVCYGQVADIGEFLSPFIQHVASEIFLRD